MRQSAENTTKKLTRLAMYLTIALIIFVLESQLPPLAPIPGIKLGLANIVTLVVMLRYGKKDALLVLVLRIIISSIFGGQVSAFLYSIAGGAVSFLVMSLCCVFIKEDKLWVISALGAVGHNAGQIAAAVLITQTPGIVFYFPLLLISGVVTGIFTGITAQIMLKRLPNSD